MEVVNARSALLSNFEVLELLRELESDHIARTKTAIRIKKEEEASGAVSVPGPGGRHPAMTEISENLRTIQVEAIQHLSADFQPTVSQTPEGITRLVKDLAKYDLTKAEKLQIVNLAPVQAVELYVIVEELEDRLGDSMEDILDQVKSSLSEPRQPVNGVHAESKVTPGELPTSNWELSYPENDPEGDMEMDAVNDLVFDDTGEGAGVEGDLDMEEE